MTLAARIAEAEARVTEVCKELPMCGSATDWVLDAFTDCLFALCDEVPHIRKYDGLGMPQNTACTIACPACRLKAKVKEALG